MVNVSDRATARQIFTALSTVDAKTPKAVVDCYERTTRLSETARSLGVADGVLAVAVADALEAGRDPAADPEVQRVLAASQIANEGVAQAVDGIAFDRFKAVCRDHADAIVQAWSKPFDQAAATLTAAHEHIGDVALEDTASIVKLGGDSAAVWAGAQSAVKVITTTLVGWSSLGEFTRLAGDDQRYRVLRLAAVDAETWTAKQLERRRLTPWDTVRAELTLSLPTFAEYRQRVATIEAGHDQAARQVEGQRKAYQSGRRVETPA